jgi:hypothetical protein
MKPIIGGKRWISIFGIFLVLSVCCSFVQAVENETGNLTTAHQETSLIENSSTSLEACKQLGKLADIATEKSIDNSETIANLTNQIYVLAALLTFFTIMVSLYSIIVQNQRNKSIELQIKSLENKFMEKFKAELMDKIDEQIDSYGKLVSKQMDKQSDKHEERLYYVEQVRSELLKQNMPDEATPDNLSKWIIGQQEDYFALLKLISPHEEETFIALYTFRERNLPYSFLALLRFLDKQNRFPGESSILAMEIAQDKFGKSLDKED